MVEKYPDFKDAFNYMMSSKRTRTILSNRSINLFEKLNDSEFMNASKQTLTGAYIYSSDTVNMINQTITIGTAGLLLHDAIHKDGPRKILKALIDD